MTYERFETQFSGLGEEAMTDIQELKKSLDLVWRLMDKYKCREMSKARDCLEQAGMWAVKGVSVNGMLAKHGEYMYDKR